METSLKNNVSHRYFQWPFVCTLAFITCFFADVLPHWMETANLPLSVLVFLEALLTLQLVLAWRETGKTRTVSYILLFLFCFRIGYRLYTTGSPMWAFRVAHIDSPFLSFLWYGMGVCFLHPYAYQIFQKIGQKNFSLSRYQRTGVLVLLALGAGFLFWWLRSVHITRDGFDWLSRATEPVWHLYMREPLTIGLHRLVFILGWRWNMLTSSTTLPLLSVLAGIWNLGWFFALIRERFDRLEDQLLAWLILLSSGGFTLLLFGHVEVYPLLLVGLLPAFFYAQRYLADQNSIAPVAFWLSASFLLHLSTGWLFPAFALLPFLKKKQISRDSLIFGAIFGILQVVFWSWLIVVYYNGSVPQFLARLHETFHVGPDKAMFIPSYSIGDPRRIKDLFNDYLYISSSGVMLLPLALWALWQTIHKKILFALTALSGYLVYTFFWNPDRGFPEDWDLFSPLSLLLSLFLIETLLSESSRNKVAVYLACIGILPYVCLQVWYHHIMVAPEAFPFFMGR